MLSCNSTSVSNIGQAAILIGSQRDSFPAVAHRLAETSFRGATVKPIILTRDKVALVDNDDYERVNQFEWYAQFVGGQWYAARTEYHPFPGRPKGKNKGFTLQRFLTNAPQGTHVRFLDGNGLNCQRSNLRLDTRDLTGLTYGQLTVIAKAGKRRYAHLWICLCDCGQSTTVSQYNWGKIVSCGCALTAMLVERNLKHGMSHTRVFKIWVRMRARCTNPNLPDWEDYGGRGITVCERWESFENFYADMGDPPSTAYSIDRRDNDGPYSPDNCRWATPLEQARNTRRNVFYTANGKTQTLSAWQAETGISSVTLRKRIDAALPPEMVLYNGRIILPNNLQLDLFARQTTKKGFA